MANYRLYVFLLLASFAFTDADEEQDNLDSIFIRFYDRKDGNIDVGLPDAAQLVSRFNPDEPVICYMHGHGESADKESVKLVTNTLFNHTNVNVLALDYRNVAKLFYLFSVEQLFKVGKLVAKAFDQMIDAGVNPKNFQIVGHSLGGQLAGIVGRNIKSKLAKITGLDPAGPLFHLDNTYLASTDAEFVIIIHTDAGVYGNALTTGTVDFYPNYGHRPQPGCTLRGAIQSMSDLCSHLRSLKFFAESIINRGAFVGVKCPNSFEYTLGQCNENEKTIMGYDTPTNVSGKYFLITNDSEPFGLGEKGAAFSGALSKKVAAGYFNSLFP